VEGSLLLFEAAAWNCDDACGIQELLAVQEIWGDLSAPGFCLGFVRDCDPRESIKGALCITTCKAGRVKDRRKYYCSCRFEA
jgi:hypothetical protein